MRVTRRLIKAAKYVYFTASTDNGPTTGWLDMSSFPFQTTRSVYAIVLKNTDPSPLSPESDEEKIEEAKTGNAEKTGRETRTCDR